MLVASIPNFVIPNLSQLIWARHNPPSPPFHCWISWGGSKSTCEIGGGGGRIYDEPKSTGTELVSVCDRVRRSPSSFPDFEMDLTRFRTI